MGSDYPSSRLENYEVPYLGTSMSVDNARSTHVLRDADDVSGHRPFVYLSVNQQTQTNGDVVRIDDCRQRTNRITAVTTAGSFLLLHVHGISIFGV